MIEALRCGVVILWVAPIRVPRAYGETSTSMSISGLRLSEDD